MKSFDSMASRDAKKKTLSPGFEINIQTNKVEIQLKKIIL